MGLFNRKKIVKIADYGKLTQDRFKKFIWWEGHLQLPISSNPVLIKYDMDLKELPLEEKEKQRLFDFIENWEEIQTTLCEYILKGKFYKENISTLEEVKEIYTLKSIEFRADGYDWVALETTHHKGSTRNRDSIKRFTLKDKTIINSNVR